MKLHWIAWLVLGALSLLAAGCVGRTAAQRPVDTPRHPEAEAYAEAQGITVEEAIRRFEVQGNVADLQERLASAEAETFGGLWIEHEPEYKVAVAFTQNGARTLRRYVKGTPLEGVAEAREVTYTLAELETVQAELLVLLDELGSGVGTGLDIRENCVSLFAADPATFEAQLEAAGRRLSDAVCIEPVGPYPEPPPQEPVEGLFFPRLDPPEGPLVEMDALLIGELVEENGCLRVRWDAEGPGVLIIWPYDHSLTVDAEGRAEVRDGSGAVVARLGDTVEMGGGRSSSLTPKLAERIPEVCPDPYWIAARGIEVAK